jgi:hypothetical protein
LYCKNSATTLPHFFTPAIDRKLSNLVRHSLHGWDKFPTPASPSLPHFSPDSGVERVGDFRCPHEKFVYTNDPAFISSRSAFNFFLSETVKVRGSADQPFAFFVIFIGAAYKAASFLVLDECEAQEVPPWRGNRRRMV